MQQSMRWLTAVLVCLLVGCKEPAIDEKPQILSMSITGIPQGNVSIDQDQRLITVLLPPSMTSLVLSPNFTFSRQAHLVDPITVDITTYCPCLAARVGGDYKTVAKLVNRVDNRHQSTHYTFLFKSGESLRIKPLPSTLVYDLKGSDYNIVVPVENYYGSSFLQAIAVTKTGSTEPNWIGGGFCFEQCAGLLNQIKIPLAGYSGTFTLKPGLHDLDLQLNDGTIVHAAGAVLVK